MAARRPGLPQPPSISVSRKLLLSHLKAIDADEDSRNRVLQMETEFRRRIGVHVDALAARPAQLKNYGTSPYVLLFYSSQQGYSRISEIEKSIVPAKVFSSMETSAGRMIETVVLPVYGWECVESAMHSADSALDGRKVETGVARVATLKSGPRCLNDEMAENFADAVLAHAPSWAAHASATKVDFTFGTLYGTQRQSNKKDWHILRNIAEKVTALGGAVVLPPTGRWGCQVRLNGIDITASVRLGTEWWAYLGSSNQCAVEVWTALVRACIAPGPIDPPGHKYFIEDLADITSLDQVPNDFNVSILQRSQLPWLLLVARHCYDGIRP